MIKICLAGNDIAKEKALLESQPDIELSIITETDIDIILSKLTFIRPDIFVISDIETTLPAEELCLSVYLQGIAGKTVIVTDKPVDYLRLESTGYTCRGFVELAQRQNIARAVRVIHDGEVWISRKLVSTMLDNLASYSSKYQLKQKFA